MTITINLPAATLDWLKAKAQTTGKDVETIVREAIEAKMALSQVSLQEAMRPIQEAVEASGMTPEEVETLIDREHAAVRAERKTASGKQ